MRKQPSPIRQATVPEYGVIAGGKLDGWSYALLRVEARGATVFLIVRATPPDWPFADEVRLHGRRDFTVLRNPGETAKRLDAETLIKAAMAAQTL